MTRRWLKCCQLILAACKLAGKRWKSGIQFHGDRKWGTSEAHSADAFWWKFGKLRLSLCLWRWSRGICHSMRAVAQSHRLQSARWKSCRGQRWAKLARNQINLKFFKLQFTYLVAESLVGCCFRWTTSHRQIQASRELCHRKWRKEGNERMATIEMTERAR